MKSKADKVIERILEENRPCTIQIIGSKKNKSKGFYLLMITQPITCIEKEKYIGIKKETLKLLDEAEIKYKIIS